MSVCNDAANTVEPSFKHWGPKLIEKISFSTLRPTGCYFPTMTLNFKKTNKNKTKYLRWSTDCKDVSSKRHEIESHLRKVVKTKVNLSPNQDTKSDVMSGSLFSITPQKPTPDRIKRLLQLILFKFVLESNHSLYVNNQWIWFVYVANV